MRLSLSQDDLREIDDTARYTMACRSLPRLFSFFIHDFGYFSHLSQRYMHDGMAGCFVSDEIYVPVLRIVRVLRLPISDGSDLFMTSVATSSIPAAKWTT